MSDTKRDSRPTLWVHGTRARDLEQVAAYLNGDAHDQSKVQVLVSGHFYTLAEMFEESR
jgi:hypothetical protein